MYNSHPQNDSTGGTLTKAQQKTQEALRRKWGRHARSCSKSRISDERRFRSAVVDGNSFELHRALHDMMGTDVSAVDFDGVTALHKAAYKGHTDTVRTLLRQRPDVDRVDCLGKTALHMAAVELHDETVQVLLRGKAQPDLHDHEGVTAARAAASRMHVQLREFWRVAPCLDLLVKGYEQERVLLRRALGAILEDPTTSNEQMLQSNQDVSPTSCTSRREHHDLKSLSYEWGSRGLNLNVSDPSLRTILGSSGDENEACIVPLLSRATRSGNLDEVRRILWDKGNPNMYDIHGHTALHVAAIHAKPHFLQTLLRARAEATQQDVEGCTPLRLVIKELFRVENYDELSRHASTLPILLLAEEEELKYMREQVRLKTEQIEREFAAEKDLSRSGALSPTSQGVANAGGDGSSALEEVDGWRRSPESRDREPADGRDRRIRIRAGVASPAPLSRVDASSGEKASKFGDRGLLLAIRTGGRLTPTMWDEV